MGDYGNTKVIQITNIAPQATRDQMHTLFSNIGKIEDLRLYPTIRDASIQIQSRCCFLKFIESSSLPLSLHMTNTVFIDRAIVVQPFVNGDLPDEWSGLEFANSAQQKGQQTLPSHVSNVTEGTTVKTIDPSLEEAGLPSFPPLPSSMDEKVIEEVRRTVTVLNIDPAVSSQACVDYFGKGAGEVKYFRWCTKEGDDRKMALIEFTDYGAVAPAMRLNDTMLGEKTIKVFYATQPITKPQAKSNEMAQKEIEEAMKKVKEAQNLVSDAVNPLKEWLGVKGSRITRSRTRSPSRSRDYYRRSRSRSRRRRSRSRDRHSRRRSRSRRRRSRSRSRRRRSRSRRKSRSRKRSRSRSKDRKKSKSKEKETNEPSKEEETAVKTEENGVKEEKAETENGSTEVKEEKRKSRSNSRSRDRKRSRSRDRRRSKSRDRRRSRSRSRKRSRRSRSRDRRSRSRDRKKRSRSRRRSRSRSRDRRRRSRSRSRDHKHKKSKKSKKSSEERDVKKEKVSRDYDAEEEGFESTNGKEEKGPVDMEISNSP